MNNQSALTEFLTARPSADPLLAALARSLAEAIDSEPEAGLAALAKEYRATVEKLRSDAAGPAGSLDDLFAEVGD